MSAPGLLDRLLGAAPAAVGRAAGAVVPALAAAAERTGVSFEALFHTARLESGFNPAARARTSSATGLFQFIDSTWLGTLARHGARHGIAPASRAEALALRTDPAVASLMAAEHMADNARTLEQGLGRPAGPTDLYLAHFLGVGGALTFLRRLGDDPAASAAALFPAAARANRPVFFHSDGTARSVAEVEAFFARKLGATGTAGRPLQLAAAQQVLPPRPGPQPADPARPPESRPDLGQQARLSAQAAYLLLADLGA